MSTKLITALDVDTQQDAMQLVARCEGCTWFKIGAQLFTRCGPSIVETVRDAGNNVFLDLKYHDIPNTVAEAAKAASALGVSLLTIHAVGARAMIAAAREAVEGTQTRILAVTVLTSLNEAMLRDEIGIPESPATAVPRLAKLAIESGAHGIVTSPREILPVRYAIGVEPLVVTPGIRPTWAVINDQQRVMTPHQACAAEANFIVVGRPIITHADPAKAVALIQEELEA